MAEGRTDIVRRDQLALAHALGVLRMARRARDAGVLDAAEALKSARDVIVEGGSGTPSGDGERGPIVETLDAALAGAGSGDPLAWAERAMQQRLDGAAAPGA